MFEFRKLASALAVQTRDTSKDKSLDLDIAQASHALKVLKGIAKEDADLVLKALKIKIDDGPPKAPSNAPKSRPVRRPSRKVRNPRRLIDRMLLFSTAYSRAH